MERLLFTTGYITATNQGTNKRETPPRRLRANELNRNLNNLKAREEIVTIKRLKGQTWKEEGGVKRDLKSRAFHCIYLYLCMYKCIYV